jgi:ADP-ribosyl-[dinitrogen reductase] hydrolase
MMTEATRPPPVTGNPSPVTGNPSPLLARARGAYLGLAIGDALGATVEFLTVREIAQKHGVHKDLVGGGWLRLKPGQITDDTQMALAMGEAILAAGGWDLAGIADRFVAWLKTKPVDVGNTCRRGITRYMRQGTLEGPESDGDGGNGAAMRMLPAVLCSAGDPALAAARVIAQAHLTHHHPLSDAACVLLSDMTEALLLRGATAPCKAMARDFVARHREFRYEPYPKRASGYIVDTMQTVLHGFLTTGSFEECLIKVVNLGGDADTTGAIAGMLAGAFYGEDEIPLRWRRTLDAEARSKVLDQAERLIALSPLLTGR